MNINEFLKSFKSTSLFLFLFLILASNAYSVITDGGTIKGLLLDNEEQPLPYSNIILKNSADSTFYKGELSNEQGSFVFTLVKNGTYYIEVSTIGFEKYIISKIEITNIATEIDLGTLKLIKSLNNLNEVVITSEKKLIERLPDKIVVNVENSILQSGASVLSVMGKLPGVQVAQEGTISLKGKPNVRVLIDGKPTMLSEENLANLLKGMSSSNVKKIEIISSPSAQYDAEGKGGIINIITKKNKNEGLNGNIKMGYGQGRYEKGNIGFDLSFKRKWYNLNFNYNFLHNKDFLKLQLMRNFPIPNHNDAMIESNSYIVTPLNSHAPRIVADLYLSKKTSISLLANIYGSVEHPSNNSRSYISENNNERINSYTFLNNTKGQWLNSNYNAHVLHQIDSSKELSVDIDYGNYLNKRNQENKIDYMDSVDNLINQSQQIINQTGRLSIYSTKADYSQLFNKNIQLNAGVKSSYVYSDYDTRLFNKISNEQIIDSSQSNHFIYSENINALYLNIKKEYKKLTAQVGIRTEQTLAKGEQLYTKQNFDRQYLHFFPSAFLNYKVNVNNELNVAIGKRIDRPSYQQMNPFRLLTDIGTYTEGNPYLKPEITYSNEITYSYKSIFFATIGYSLTYDKIVFTLVHNPEKGITSRTPFNVKQSHIYNMDLVYSKKLTSWWTTNTSWSPYYQVIEGDINGYRVPNLGTPSFQINTNNSFYLMDGLAMECGFLYMYRSQRGTSIVEPFYNLSLGVRKTLFNERATLVLNISDLLLTDSRKGVAYFGNSDMNLTSHYTIHWDSRVISLNFSYRFAGIKTNRVSRTTGVDDEKKRINVN